MPALDHADGALWYSEMFNRTPALGTASIRFNAADWANFLMHPLLTSQLPSDVRFKRAGATLAPGEARWSVDWRGTPLQACLTQQRGEPAVVSVEPAYDEAAAFLSTFFNGLVIDLDGCELTFNTLDVSAVELSLGLAVYVRKFPSPFINF